MSKNTRWILLFALVVLIYSFAQFFEQQKSNDFKSPLVNFYPEEIQSIRISSENETSFQLLKSNNSWLLSSNNIHEVAKDKEVEQLLKLLKTIRTTEITSQKQADWRVYGLNKDQGTLVCLETNDEALPCIRFGAIEFSEQDHQLKSFARLDQQEQVYALNGFSMVKLNSNFNDYRNKQVLKTDVSITKMSFFVDTTTYTYSKWMGNWVDEELKLMDSIRWQNISQSYTDLSLDAFADDLDELAIEQHRLLSVKLYTAKDSFQLDCFADSTYSLPFILHSDQFPRTWMACDSSEFFELIPKEIFDF